MKFTAKRSARLLAAILAILMVLSTVSVCFSAFAEESVYTVEYTSPAIPMTAGTIVSMESLEFETSLGTVISGAEATISLVNEADKDKVAIDGATILARKKGVYEAVVTSGSDEMTVYIVVKAKNETKWTLYSADFDSAEWNPADATSKALPDDWVYQIGGQKIGLTTVLQQTTAVQHSNVEGISSDENGILVTGNAPTVAEVGKTADDTTSAFLTLNNTCVNAFRDYTVKADMLAYVDSVAASLTARNGTMGVGFFVRAVGADANGKFTVGSSSTFNTDVFAVNVNPDDTFGGYAGYAKFNKFMKATLATNQDNVYKWTTVDRCSVESGAVMPASLSLSLKLDGTTATLSEAAGDTATYENITLPDRTGNVGIYVGYADGNYAVVKNFNVYLNNAAYECPPYTQNDKADDGTTLYRVDLERTPAIPMNANTYVQLKHLAFAVDGIDYYDTEVTVISKNEGISIVGGAIYAYETGVYPITVEGEGFSATAYVVVKDIDDDMWYLYNESFTDDYDEYKMGYKNEFPENWKSQAVIQSAGASGFLEYPYMSYYNAQNVYMDPQSEPMDGAFPFTDPYNYGWSNSNNHTARGYFTLTTDAISAFNDFTIYYEGKTWTNEDWRAAGTGLFGRAVTQNGLLTRNVTNSVVAFSANNINTSTGLNSVGDGATMTVKKQTLNAATPSWSIATLTTNTGKAWANWNTVSKKSNDSNNNGADTRYALKYDGTTAYFWNPDDESAGYYSTQVADGKGSVGVFAGVISDGSASTGYSHTWASVDSFAVALNNAPDELPHATVINPVDALGATIRPETSAATAGLRFGARVYSLQLSDGAVLSDDTVTVGGKEYPVKGYGAILLPKVLLGGNELIHGIDPDIVDTEITEYSAANENYAEAVITLTGIPEKYKNLDIAFRAYIAYYAGGETKYVYSDTLVRNFYDTQKAISGIYPLDVINPDFSATDFSTFDITYDSMTNQGVWETPDGVYDEEAEELEAEIETYSDILKNNSNGKYYVDPSATSNGSGTQSSPFNNLQTAIDRAKSLTWLRSYTILIKRGTVIRGNFTIPAKISLGAYGDTSLPKPVIMGSDKNYADLTWSETATENVYSVACSHDNVGNVVFNYGQAIGRFRDSVAELENNFDYYADGTNLYVYCNVGNLGEICQSIELSYKSGRAILVINSNCTLENLQVMFGGAHGIQANDTSGVTIRGCEVGFMGGAETGTAGVYYGNGIEFWNGTTDATIDSCYVFQCFDSAVTHQFTDQSSDTTANFENITYSNNLIEYNVMGFEYFNTTSDTSDCMTDISFDSNIVRFSGYGFGWYSRPAAEHEVGSNIKGNGSNDNKSSNFTVTNNYLDRARQSLIMMNSLNNAYNPTFSGNHYAVGTKDCILRLGIRGSGYRAYSDDYQINDALAILGDTNAMLDSGGVNAPTRSLTGNAAAPARTLNNTAYKAAVENELSVVYLGGSVTHGQGASNSTLTTGTSWAALVHQHLMEKYPDATIKGYNAAIGGTGSYFGLHRLGRDVYPSDPDLIFIDFAVNDLYQSYTEAQSTVFMESLITNIQAKYPDADIVMVLVTNEAHCGADYTNLLAHEAVANHYGIPVINVGEALGEKISAGDSWSKYSGDSVHPNDAGYKVYADAIIPVLDRLLPVSPTEAEAHYLPKQYITNLLEDAMMVTADQIGAQTGWNLTATTSSNSATNSLRGYGKISQALIPSASGATLTYEFTGSAFGMIVEPGYSQNVTVTIDGVTTAKMVESSGEEKIIKVIFDNLRDGEHTVEITYGGSGEFAVGAFLIG